MDNSGATLAALGAVWETSYRSVRPIVTQMADAGVAAATDFDWASQMRFYWRGDDETGHLKVRLPIPNAMLE